uniref:Pleckstrin homology domain containing B1 n=1 Tax=Anas zonorhyncha TaxID=75864 RepID=A0A8B9VL18_9AVES
MALVKSGWLWRQSSILRRWKRNWFVLYLDGSLLYYHDQTQRDMDGRLHIKHSCRDVRIGPECRDVQPPEGKSRECLLSLVLRDASKTSLCAESEDDAVAWKLALLEAKSTPVRLPPPQNIPQKGVGYWGRGSGGPKRSPVNVGVSPGVWADRCLPHGVKGVGQS